ncbi:MAG: EcsC family protein [Propionibacteriaceae bacterium]
MATSARDVGKVIATIPGRVGPTAGSALLRLVDLAIDGVSTLPGAKTSAAKALQKRGDADAAVDWLITSHVAMASAQGFATNVGGVVTTILTTPANITGVVIIQMRLVACIAHLRGYDIDDRRVRTAMLMCLLGDEELRRQIESGRLPTSPMAVATAPVSDAALDLKVAERIVADVLTNIGGKRLSSLVGRKIPLIGGGVGAIYDGYGTHLIGQCAKAQLPKRRRSS